MSKLYRGPSIDTSYQCSVHLASGFRGDTKMAIQKQELHVAAIFVNELGFVLSFPKAE
jgi:hypothetical protein